MPRHSTQFVTEDGDIIKVANENGTTEIYHDTGRMSGLILTLSAQDTNTLIMALQFVNAGKSSNEPIDPANTQPG